jgi:mevalonate pyrophosphate decarboxylase
MSKGIQDNGDIFSVWISDQRGARYATMQNVILYFMFCPLRSLAAAEAMPFHEISCRSQASFIYMWQETEDLLEK